MHMMRRLKSIASGRSSVSDPVSYLPDSYEFSPIFVFNLPYLLLGSSTSLVIGFDFILIFGLKSEIGYTHSSFCV